MRARALQSVPQASVATSYEMVLGYQISCQCAFRWSERQTDDAAHRQVRVRHSDWRRGVQGFGLVKLPSRLRMLEGLPSVIDCATDDLMATRPPLHLQRKQRAQASSLMVTKRCDGEKTSKVSSRLGHGYDIHTDTPSEVTETATPPGIRDCPSAFGPRIRSQASDDVVVGCSGYARQD